MNDKHKKKTGINCNKPKGALLKLMMRLSVQKKRLWKGIKDGTESLSTLYLLSIMVSGALSL